MLSRVLGRVQALPMSGPSIIALTESMHAKIYSSIFSALPTEEIDEAFR